MNKIRLKEIEDQEEQRVENPVAQKKPRGRPKKDEKEKKRLKKQATSN